MYANCLACFTTLLSKDTIVPADSTISEYDRSYDEVAKNSRRK